MSYFYLTLDTAPPDIRIQAPAWVHLDDSFGTIEITSNELLDQWQQFYLVDSSGIRHDFIFDYRGGSFDGLLSLHGIPTGIAIIYAQAQDTVWNRSALVSVVIEIRPSKHSGAYGTLTVLVRTLTPLGFR